MLELSNLYPEFIKYNQSVNKQRAYLSGDAEQAAMIEFEAYFLKKIFLKNVFTSKAFKLEDEDENDSVVMDMENPIADEIIMDEVARELAELNLFGFKEIIGSRKRKQS